MFQANSALSWIFTTVGRTESDELLFFGKFTSAFQVLNTDLVICNMEPTVKLNIELKDTTIKLNEGEMVIIPKRVEHRPYSKDECLIMLIEPKNVKKR